MRFRPTSHGYEISASYPWLVLHMQRLPCTSRRLEIRLPVSGLEWCPGCHPERSEGSLRPSSQTLRCAQGDRQYLQMSSVETACLTDTSPCFIMNMLDDSRLAIDFLCQHCKVYTREVCLWLTVWDSSLETTVSLACLDEEALPRSI